MPPCKELQSHRPFSGSLGRGHFLPTQLEICSGSGSHPFSVQTVRCSKWGFASSLHFMWQISPILWLLHVLLELWGVQTHSPWLICFSFRFGQGLRTQGGGGPGVGGDGAHPMGVQTCNLSFSKILSPLHSSLQTVPSFGGVLSQDHTFPFISLQTNQEDQSTNI